MYSIMLLNYSHWSFKEYNVSLKIHFIIVLWWYIVNDSFCDKIFPYVIIFLKISQKKCWEIWLKGLSHCASGRTRNSCKVTRRPSSDMKGRDRSPVSNVIIDVVKKMAAPVTVLHVTPMGAFRSDAHVGTWSDNPSVPDCSHWCLPGVPDTWNEVLFSYLLSENGTFLQRTPGWISSFHSVFQLTWDAEDEELSIMILLPCLEK